MLKIALPLVLSMLAGQPVPPPMDPKVQLPRVDLDEKKVEFGDNIDEKLFPDGLSHDFGQVQRGTQLRHAFRVVNTTNKPLRISSVRVFMNRALRVRSSKDVLQPNEEGKIELFYDTEQFVGAKTGTVYVQSDNGKFREHRLWISAVSRDDLEFVPNSLDFGKIQKGETPSAHMVVTVLDQPKLQVTQATCNNKFIDVQVKELDRDTTRAVFQVSATLRADIPAGAIRTHVELKTNNPAMPKLLVPVSVVVETPK